MLTSERRPAKRSYLCKRSFSDVSSMLRELFMVFIPLLPEVAKLGNKICCISDWISDLGSLLESGGVSDTIAGEPA